MIQFRIAAAEDLQTIKSLLEQLYLELGDERDSLQFLSTELIRETMRSGKTEIYFAVENETVLGLLTLTESQAIYAGGNYGTIDEMYILPEFRGNSTGTRFIEFVCLLAKKRKWQRLDVTAPTEAKWQKSIDFYESNGFQFTGPKLKKKINP